MGFRATFASHRPPVGPIAINHQSPQAVGLVSWIPSLAGRSGRVVDLVTNQVGQHQNGAGFINEARHGPSLDLDGSDDYVSFADHQAYDLTGSFSMFFRMTTTTNEGIVIAKRPNASDANFILSANSSSSVGTFTLYWMNPSSVVHSAEVTDNFGSGPMDLLIVHDNVAETISFYINGIADSGNPHSRAAGFLGNSGALTIGAQNEALLNGYFDAGISDIRFYSRALSAVEAKHLSDPRHRFDLYRQANRRRTAYVEPTSGGGAFGVFGSSVIRPAF